MTSVYIVLSPSESERKKIILKILSKIVNPALSSYEAGEVSMDKVLLRFQTPDLFAPVTGVLLEKCEQLKKEELLLLQEHLENLPPQAFLILSGSSLKQRLQHKELISVDYSEEKPWQRQRRFKGWLLEEAKKAGKVLSTEVVEMLLLGAGEDFSYVEQELFKLICFAGDRLKIERADAKQLLSSPVSLTGWQIAESLIWGEAEIGEVPFDLSYIGQIRYHLQLGAEISSCLEKGSSSQEIFTSLPHFKSKMLEKYLPLVQQKKSGFFKKGLQALFELELKMKSSGVAPELLFAYFQGQLK